VAADLLDRLSDKFLVGDGCWEWTAARNSYGYGQIWRDGRMAPAHRVLYELLVGPIPEGLHIDHLCRNRGCVRPDHLEPVTCRENLLRGETLPAKQAATTHCPSGHEYAGANLRVETSGKRKCKTCQLAHNRRYYGALIREVEVQHRG
jgi:hypothetical protein